MIALISGNFVLTVHIKTWLKKEKHHRNLFETNSWAITMETNSNSMKFRIFLSEFCKFHYCPFKNCKSRIFTTYVRMHLHYFALWTRSISRYEFRARWRDLFYSLELSFFHAFHINFTALCTFSLQIGHSMLCLTRLTRLNTHQSYEARNPKEP